MGEGPSKNEQDGEGKPERFPGRVWNVLNSPLGLFLLSSVLVSGVARFYTDHKERLERQRIRNTEVARLATELDYRVTQIRHLAGRLATGALSDQDQTGTAVLLWRAACGEQAFQPTVPELKNIHSLALVSRLKLLGVPEHMPPVADAFAYIEYGKDSAWRYGDQQELQRRVAQLASYRDAVLGEVERLSNQLH
jgi:hypothetical protein